MSDDPFSLAPPVGEPRERLASLAGELGVDWLVLVGEPWVFWSTGYHRYGSGLCAAALAPSGEARLWVARHELDAARRSTVDVEVADYTTEGFGLLSDPVAALAPVLGAALEQRALARVGAPWLSGARDVEDEVNVLRMRKSPREVKEIARRVALAWSAQRAVADAVGRGASEIEIFSLARATAEGDWGGPVEMVADVLAGSATSGVAAPTAVAGRRAVADGDALIADLVLGADGYYADVTWTHLRGRNDALRSRRDQLLEVLERMAAALRPGRVARDVFAEMNERLAAIGPGRGLAHHAGHGIGLAGYEAPYLAPFDDTPLAPGMVVALEPGFYDERGGVRVERDYLITAEGGVELPGRPEGFGDGHG